MAHDSALTSSLDSPKLDQATSDLVTRYEVDVASTKLFLKGLNRDFLHLSVVKNLQRALCLHQEQHGGAEHYIVISEVKGKPRLELVLTKRGFRIINCELEFPRRVKMVHILSDGLTLAQRQQQLADRLLDIANNFEHYLSIKECSKLRQMVQVCATALWCPCICVSVLKDVAREDFNENWAKVQRLANAV